MRFLILLKTSAIIAPAVLLSSLAHAQPETRHAQDDWRPTIECAAEAAAFLEVASLADRFQNDAKVFAGSLYELREQLFDCLATSGEEETPNLSSDSRALVDPI